LRHVPACGAKGNRADWVFVRAWRQAHGRPNHSRRDVVADEEANISVDDAEAAARAVQAGVAFEQEPDGPRSGDVTVTKA
jgi:hypothetical protein